jgi:hypothetical protein
VKTTAHEYREAVLGTTHTYPRRGQRRVRFAALSTSTRRNVAGRLVVTQGKKAVAYDVAEYSVRGRPGVRLFHCRRVDNRRVSTVELLPNGRTACTCDGCVAAATDRAARLRGEALHDTAGCVHQDAVLVIVRERWGDGHRPDWFDAAPLRPSATVPF